MQENIQAVREDRQKTYGDPWENHEGIGKQWGALLRHVGRHIADGGDVPPSLVAACMTAVKLNRCRIPRVYHQDNTIDAHAYMEMVDEFRAREVQNPTPQAHRQPVNGIHRVYVAGAYTGDSTEQIEENCRRARVATFLIMSNGHDAHCPHDATHQVSEYAKSVKFPYDYERWMRLDFGIIERWATALYVVSESPGTLREIKRAKDNGVAVWRSMDEVPLVGKP